MRTRRSLGARGTKAIRPGHDALLLWGGPECTIARIRDEWRDQSEATGHRHRQHDIDLLAGLGITTVRYPILWEHVAPSRPDRMDFSWTDQRIGMLGKRGIAVVAGLLHHGSGPAYTHLLDPGFPEKFAEYAGRVAGRYPHIALWTPINEPLTTARFSALYGHWYPHLRDYPAFLRALVNQCRGIAQAMAAIRAVNPAAQLVQTEDLGKTFSTPALDYQAAHENQRRWLSLDLLAGRVGPSHPLYGFLIDAGIAVAELEELETGAARPDLIGANHYLTSDRFLDDRLDLYPRHQAGGNGRHAYVDAEAVRIGPLAADVGLGPRLREAWQRYRVPLAVTEVHHGCTRDEQLRWLVEAWNTAHDLRGEGVDVRAVTLWSTFGSVDWRSLLTRDEGAYDAGAFDIRAPAPRPTAIARAVTAMAAGQSFDHPVLDGAGWWRRPDRLYRWCGGDPVTAPRACRRLLIVGATGTLGQGLARIAARRGLAVHATKRAELDVRDSRSIAATLDAVEPWAIINAAGFVRVADAEQEVDSCMSVNAGGAANLARAAAARGIPFVTFSSDLAFNGLLGRPYVESDIPCPASVYGHSKLSAEQLVAAVGGQSLIIRASAFFGPWDRYNFAWSVLDSLRRGEPFSASASDIVSPTFVPDLCHAVLDLLIDAETGIWHLANQGRIAWCDFARAIARRAGFDPELIFARDAGPVRITALASERGTLLRPLGEALDDYLRDVGALGTGSVLPSACGYSAAATRISAVAG